jgi:hypothetical protein
MPATPITKNKSPRSKFDKRDFFSPFPNNRLIRQTFDDENSLCFRCVSEVSVGKPEAGVGQAGLRGGLGRVQPLVPLLLHVLVGQAEQQVSLVPAGMGDPTPRPVKE